MTDEELQAVAVTLMDKSLPTRSPWYMLPLKSLFDEIHRLRKAVADERRECIAICLSEPASLVEALSMCQPAIGSELERLRPLVPTLKELLAFAERAEEELEAWRNGADVRPGPLPPEIVNARAALAQIPGLAHPPAPPPQQQ